MVAIYNEHVIIYFWKVLYNFSMIDIFISKTDLLVENTAFVTTSYL